MYSSSVSSASPILPSRDPRGNAQMFEYQRTLFERSIHSNLLIALSRRTDKIQIAINLIKKKLSQTDGPYPEEARRIVFISPTLSLLHQQFQIIKREIRPHTFAKLDDHYAKLLKSDDWFQFFFANQIVCMTPATLKDAISKGHIHFNNINLMICDNAHHVVPSIFRVTYHNHEYRQLMDLYREWLLHSAPNESGRPRILGLCDSLFGTEIRPFDVLSRIRQFEELMHAKYSDDIERYINKAKEKPKNLYAIELNSLNNNPKKDSEVMEIPSKFAALLNIFRVFQTTELKCIVFVQERAEAYSVYKLLSSLVCDKSSDLSFIKPDILCGSPSTWYSIMSKDCKRLFKDKLLNVLIVETSLLEDEGIDQLPICNLVVQYNFPVNNFREFVMSKSLVNEKYCYFLLLIDSIHEKEATLNWEKQLVNYYRLEKFLENNRNICTLAPFVSKEDEPKFYATKSGAVLSERNAPLILKDYLKCFPVDFLAESNFQLLTQPVKANEPNRAQRFAYLLIWPLNCTMKGIVFGDYRTCVKAAKANCAYTACMALYECGEIGQHLNVLEKQFHLSKHALELNFRMWSTDSTSTKEIHRSSDHQSERLSYLNTFKVFSTNSFTEYFLYIIDFTNYYSLFGLSESHDLETIGFLTPSCLLSPVIESLIYLNENQIKCSIRLVQKQPMKFEQEALEMIKFFHSHVIENVIRKPFIRRKTQGQTTEQSSKDQSTTSQTSQQSNGFFLVPIRIQNSAQGSPQYEINFNLQKSLLDWHYLAQQLKISKISQNSVTKHSNLSETFPLNCLFTTVQKECQKYVKIRMLRGISDVLPTELFNVKNVSMTYIQHYSKMGFEIVHSEVPLLKSMLLETNMRRFWKFKLTKSKLRLDKYTDNVRNKSPPIMSPAEFALIYPLSLPLCRLLNAFPPIAYRLEQFMLGEKFLLLVSGGMLDYDREIDVESLFTENTLSNQNKGRSVTVDESTEQLVLYNNNNNNNKRPCVDHVVSFKLLKVNEFGVKTRTSTTTQQSTSSFVNLQYGQTTTLTFEGDIKPHIGDIRFDTYDQLKLKWPNPWHIVKALTLSQAADVWNMEQMETVGDSFLKVTTSLYLYFNYPAYDDGKLAQLMSSLVSNENLYKLAKERDNCLIARYIKSARLVINKNWHMPFYMTDSVQELVRIGVFDKSNRRQIGNKSIADCVESLIGACCLFGSTGAAVRFLRWLGLVTFDPNLYMKSELRNPSQYFSHRGYKNHFEEIRFEDPKKLDQVTENYKRAFEDMVRKTYHHRHFAQVESKIGYRFKQRYFLVQAFTHVSYCENVRPNHIASNQRLVFIGNAVLEYMITYFVYQRNHQLSPDEITRLRSAVLNKTFVASIVVKYGLHKYLRSSSVHLSERISQYVKSFHCQHENQLFDNGQKKIVNIGEYDGLKTLQDIFEALAGAIYIDNGLSMDALWRVVYRMIKVELDYFMEHIPSHALLWLNSNHPKRFKFSDLIEVDEKRKKIEIIITHQEDGGKKKRFVGFGESRKQCTNSAARQAMEFLMNNECK